MHLKWHGLIRDNSIPTEGLEASAIFSATRMRSSASAGSVVKAVEQLPGAREAVLDVEVSWPKSMPTEAFGAVAVMLFPVPGDALQ